MEGMIWLLVGLLIIAGIGAVVWLLVSRAPFIPPDIKAILMWVILAVTVIWMLLYFVRHIGHDAVDLTQAPVAQVYLA